MATILVTITNAGHRVDLALPGEVQLARLVPAIAAYFTDESTVAGSMWALSPVGRSSFPPSRSLSQCGVVNGSILEIHEIGRASAPLTGPATAPSLRPMREARAPGEEPPPPQTAFSTPAPKPSDAALPRPVAVPPPAFDTILNGEMGSPTDPGMRPARPTTAQGEWDEPPPPSARSSMPGPINWPPDPASDPSPEPHDERGAPNPWDPPDDQHGAWGAPPPPRRPAPEHFVSADSPAWDQPAEHLWTRQPGPQPQAKRGADPRRPEEPVPAGRPTHRRRGATDEMAELDEAMAAPTGGRGRARAANKTSSAADTSFSTALGFIVMVASAAGFATRYALSIGKPITTVALLVGGGTLAALYFGGLRYGLLEPVLDRIPGGESLLALGGSTGHGRTKIPLTQAEIADRLERLGMFVEDFMYDLALLLAGHNPPLDYVAHATAQKLRANVAPFLQSGQRLSPNFGQHGEMKVKWDPDNDVDPVSCEVTFDDMSTRETAAGERIIGGRRKVLVTLSLDPTISRVLDASLQPAPSQSHTAASPER